MTRSPSALAALHARVFTLPPPWSAGDFAQLLDDPGVHLLQTAPEGVLHGFAMFRRAADEAELLTLAVAAERRRRGIARELLSRGIADMRAAGARAMFLEVACNNTAAVSLYAALGFVQCGHRPRYYRDGADRAVDALVLRCALA